MDLPPDQPFVCFFARDSSYLSSTYGHKDWNYHNYRDSDIDDYLVAASELTERGYFALRVGAIVGKPLATLSPGVLDYASDHRTDFMDIYLAANCRFFLTSGAGIDVVSRVFRRPIASVNSIPLEFLSTWGPQDLTIPRKLWIRDERRFMTFQEILDSGVGRFMDQSQYDSSGLEPVPNTPDDIRALAVEMDERLNGTWSPSDEDEELQKRFWSLYRPSEMNGVFLSRIGAEFLRQNVDLLN
jgi:putative glycosyltransferase (TIGR04372 family)